MQSAILFTGLTYLAGGVLFAIALFRANVLARWASALLAVGTLSSIGAGIVPQYERLFAIPTGLALVGLGYSLWRAQRTSAALPVLNPVSSTSTRSESVTSRPRAPPRSARFDRVGRRWWTRRRDRRAISGNRSAVLLFRPTTTHLR